ncbi:MAG TPA: hypothetical protein VK187_04685 [Geobacteraceae bacterium]|nr:hypothetical protein [Geobacteraceae bacterium]
MERILWLFNNYDDNRGLWGAFLASLLLHVLMFAVMATTSIFYPVTGDTSKLDVVWLYPSFLLGGNAEPVAAPPEPVHVEEALAPPRERAPAPVAIKPLPEPEKIASKPRDTEPVQPPSPLRDEQKATAETAVPSPEPEESESEPEMTLPAAASPQVAKTETKPSETERKPPKTETRPPRTETLAEKPAPRENPVVVRPKIETPKEAVPPAVTREIKTAAVVKPAPQPPASPPPQVRKDTPATVAPTKEEPPRAVDHPVTVKKPAPATTPPAALPAVKANGPGPAMAQKKVEPLPVTRTAKEEKPPEKTAAKPSVTKGIFAPPLVGDLKLEISAPPEALNGVKIAVRFCEYPKTRHNRPMPKGDARRVQTLTPKIAKQSENSIVAVIESSDEGIYEFRNMSDSSNAAKADFKIKVYENSSRAKTKQVGKGKIGEKGTIVKILMPEGILWDDEAAFSGSMEDADSITKFNTDTGLVWKEYRD